jgi:glucosamine-6-phosphate deaminase
LYTNYNPNQQFMARLNLLEETRYEKLPVSVYASQHSASLAVAARIARLVRGKQALGQQTVLGLATGVTPIGVYAELIRLHKEEGLSFKDVVTFNLDEYYPMKPDAAQSYVTFMNENLFNHIDIDKSKVHIPDGTLAQEDVARLLPGLRKANRGAGRAGPAAAGHWAYGPHRL